MDKLLKLKELVDEAVKDGTAFYEKGNDTAGTRFRKALMSIKTESDSLRKDVISVRNERKKDSKK